MTLRHYFLVAICAFGFGCHPRPNASAPADRREPVASPSTRDNAYSLLLDLLSQQKDVSKLLIIKEDSRELNRLIKEISKASGDAVDQLKKFGKQDGSLTFEVTKLPPAEVATRKAIAATKTKELLGTSGDPFELALLLTQLEALNYASHLAQVAAANESNANRASWLTTFSQQMKELHTRCVELVSRRPHSK